MNLDELERIAQAAQDRSPGPWKRLRLGKGEVTGTKDRFDFIVDSSPIPDWHEMPSLYDGNRVLETDGGYYEPKDEIGAYIAAMSPDVVLRLIACARDAMEVHRLRTIIEACDVHVARLKERIRELEKRTPSCPDCPHCIRVRMAAFR